MVAMSFAILNTWIAIAGTMGLVLPSGGAVSLIYGFIFCVLCNFALVSSLGELTAIWPTAGGQYHFVYALCTDSWKNLMSFLVGWVNIAGWLTLVTTEGFFGGMLSLSLSPSPSTLRVPRIDIEINLRFYFADFFQTIAQFISAAAVMASGGKYQAEPWATYLIFLAMLTFATILNIFGNKILGQWNNVALYWSILSVVIMCVVLLATSEKTDAKTVFTEFQNETGWPNGVAWILGMLQSALSLIGFDVVLHMTEEMPNPSRDAPLALVYAIGVGGTTGIAVALVVLFCLVDPAIVLESETGLPIVDMIYRATGSRAAATVIALMLSVCFVNGTNGSTTSVSRLLYSMARDKGIFFHEFFSHLHPKWNVPIRTIMLSFVFNVLFGLLYLGPAVAFNAYISSCTIFLNVSYAFPVIMVLIRGRKVLDRFQTAETPFKLGKIRGLILNWISATYVVFISIFLCFPPGLPVSANLMNYVTAVIGIFAVFITIYWVVYGKTFQGPHFDEIIGQNMADQGMVVQGDLKKDHSSKASKEELEHAHGA
ncbi:hypothetical protein SAPIO_CDS10582 [Scedosporium apiospermum]|uniref:Choline transport protein n=1 Tax=Pseudallescheria apiosperma TaxID=563466 RepID=A0A084FU29_PSEDA|nr:uncharacterized protein SAPIO_CDS10582 [Scedosporium apiospermum]KEZ38591.1 hypothetical protein SAPIO_CDS10582 [Scedosporium apiospermum]